MFSLKNDVIFKYVFGYEKNKHILIALLNTILGLEKGNEIIDVTILNVLNLKEYLTDKFSILDIKAADNKGIRYNIEMQVREDTAYIPRVMFYIDKLFTEQLKQGESFDELNKAISISVLDFTLLKEENRIHNVYRYKNIESGKELTDIKEIHFIELPKFNKDKPKELQNKFEKWIYAFKFGELYVENIEKIPEELKEEEAIVMAITEMKSAVADNMVREILSQREKALHDEATRMLHAEKRAEKRGLERGMQQGMQQGEYKKATETAKNMLAKGFDIEVVSEITELSIDEIKKIC